MTDGELQKIADGLSLEQKIGQLWNAGICAGETLEFARRNFERFHFGGLMFSGNFQQFVRADNYMPCGVARNAPLPEVARFLYDIKKASLEINGVPVLIGGDQEGGMCGSVFRRRETTILPKPMALAATTTPEADAYQAAAIAAREVKVLGLDMLYGPVLDVNSNPDNPEVGNRSFSDNAAVCAALGAQFVTAYAAEGVISTGKHFPGRGRGRGDAHLGLETFPADRASLEALDILPFRRAIAAGVEAIMVCHSVFPAFDPDLPASLSRRVITGYLREELGFQGLILPDEQTMWAIAKNFDVPRACAMALEAGADWCFMKDPPRYAATLAEILASLKAGRLMEEQLHDSLLRVLRLKARHGLFDLPEYSAERVRGVVGCAAHHAAARSMAERSLMVLKNEGGRLPMGASRPTILAVVPRDMSVIVANDANLSHEMLPRALARRFPGVQHVLVDMSPTEHQAFEAAARARNADLVVFGIYAGGLTKGLRELLESLLGKGRPVVVLLANAPYEAKRLPDAVAATVCCFNAGPAQFDAFAGYLAGAVVPSARLPVTLGSRT